MFKTAISNLLKPDERVVITTISGEKDRPNYKPKYKDNGSYELVEDGKIHSYEGIQAWKNTTDMSAIMERYIRTGDSSILQQRAGFYADVTALPKNYVELANTLRDADNFFNALPIEIKKQYDMNPAIFYANEDNVMEVVNGYFRKASEAPIPSPAPVPNAGAIEDFLPNLSVPEGGTIVNE